MPYTMYMYRRYMTYMTYMRSLEDVEAVVKLRLGEGPRSQCSPARRHLDLHAQSRIGPRHGSENTADRGAAGATRSARQADSLAASTGCRASSRKSLEELEQVRLRLVHGLSREHPQESGGVGAGAAEPRIAHGLDPRQPDLAGSWATLMFKGRQQP